MDPKKLAAAGFFYTKKKDTVKCFECQITLSNWIADDNPKAEHQRWSGKCRFVRNVPCGNIPIGADPSTISKIPKRVDICGLYGLKYMALSAPDNDPQEIPEAVESVVNSDSSSKQPTYASYERRLRSFEICTYDTIYEKKEELAKAGFFYLSGLFEPSDQTMCFYCGKCLRAWERTDDPVKEHIRWYPQCKFIKKILAQKEKSELCTKQTDHESEIPTKCDYRFLI
ncbi:DIAP1 inhibitor, partial [Acromyrmex heyeri]